MSDQHPRDDGGPAIPSPYTPTALGISIRDWLAGLAMQSHITHFGWPADHVAKLAYQHADAILAERRKGSATYDTREIPSS